MKSKMKKLVSLVLAMAMVLTMSMTAFAEDSYTITINNEATGHTYEAYQIFSGTLSDGKLTGIDWGTGVNTTTTVNNLTLLEAIQAIENSSNTMPFSSCSTAENVADVLASNTSLAETFADVVSAYLVTTAASTSTYANSAYTITVSSVGYYLVKDEDSSLEGQDDAYTDYILQVLGNETIDAKSSTPTVEKKVEEKNDSTGTTTGWQDAADYDINDSINYKLTGTLPSTLDDYSAYYYVFTDTLSAGLTFNMAGASIATTDVTVTVYASVTATTGTVVASGYAVSLTDYTTTATDDPYEGGTVLKVTIDDVYKLLDENNESIDVTKDSTIVVTYSATLNSSANIGADGNPNEVVLTYSNNPNNAGSGETGTTPEDKVTVFTFTLVVNKTDGTDALNGAGFTLYKYNASSTATDKYEAVGDEIVGTSTSVFTFKGLDSGLYKIVESTTPEGYNTAADLYFEIAATYEGDINASDPSLLTLVVKDSGGNTISDGTDATFASVLASGTVSTEVVNKKGSTLPSTGGIGTTIFYIVGAILVLGAGVVLVTRRRTAR